MASTYDLSEELIMWAKLYGKEKTAKSGGLYYGFDYKRGERAKALVYLIETLKDLGAEKGTFKGGPTRDVIIRFCLPPKHQFDRPKKYGRACLCVAKELDTAVLEVFGSESDYYRKNGQTRNIVLEKSDAEMEHELLEAEDPDKIIEEVKVVPNVAAAPVYEAVPKKKWKDIEKQLIESGQLVKEDPNHGIDAELADLFGIKKDE